MFGKIWKDSVWSKVIATGIIGILVCAVHLAGLDQHVKSYINVTVLFLSHKTSIPNWITIPLSFFFLIYIVKFTKRKLKSETPLSRKQPAFMSYNSDVFFDIKWIWKVDEEQQISGISSFCPDCNYELIYETIISENKSEQIQYVCEKCKRNFNRLDYKSPQILHNAVKRRVEHNYRTGKWKGITDTQSHFNTTSQMRLGNNARR